MRTDADLAARSVARSVLPTPHRDVAGVDERVAGAAVDVVALAVLVWGWPRRKSLGHQLST
jgi:hypothetical protein